MPRGMLNSCNVSEPMVPSSFQSHPFPITVFGRKPTMREEIASFVNHCLVNLDRHESMLDRRRDQRYSFPILIRLTPVDLSSMRVIGDPVLVVGKHISVSGLGFFHAYSLPHATFLVSVANDGGTTELVWKSRWCRFLADGWYESGGQFIRLNRSHPQ